MNLPSFASNMTISALGEMNTRGAVGPVGRSIIRMPTSISSVA